MNRFFVFCCVVCFFCFGAASFVFAQDETIATAPSPLMEDVPAAPTELPKKKEYETMPQVRLRILDKVRAISRTYDLDVDHTVAYATIRIRPRTCRKSSPLDDPENAAFLQIWEVMPDKKSDWVFSGWMFSSSPSLSAMDHPVYDVTVLDCRNPKAVSPSDTKKQDVPEVVPDVAPSSDAASINDALDEYISTDDTP